MKYLHYNQLGPIPSTRPDQINNKCFSANKREGEHCLEMLRFFSQETLTRNKNLKLQENQDYTETQKGEKKKMFAGNGLDQPAHQMTDVTDIYGVFTCRKAPALLIPNTR